MQKPNRSNEPSRPAASRRRFFSAAAGAGAATAAVLALPRLAPSDPSAAEPVRAAPKNGGGYHVSAHVQRYYQSARV